MKNQIARMLLVLPLLYQASSVAQVVSENAAQTPQTRSMASVPAVKMQADLECEYETEYDFSQEIVENLEKMNSKQVAVNAKKGARHAN